MVMALRAVLASARGAEPGTILPEAVALAEIGGFRRALSDAHPGVAAMVSRLRAPTSESGPARPQAPTPAAAPGAGGLLTPREAHILGLLSSGMSNKLIARAMEISDETVKWHLKNLFAKLSAGSRQHAVGRARLLGLIPG
jgi:LuxR family maltose regulon positive regulatory protein